MTNNYELLLVHQPGAVRNATTLLNRYAPWNPERDNPSTNVYMIVQRLNELAG